jgi:hypothetical protein
MGGEMCWWVWGAAACVGCVFIYLYCCVDSTCYACGDCAASVVKLGFPYLWNQVRLCILISVWSFLLLLPLVFLAVQTLQILLNRVLMTSWFYLTITMLSMNLIFIELDFINLNLARIRGCQSIYCYCYLFQNLIWLLDSKMPINFKCMNYGPFFQSWLFISMMPSSSRT